MKRFIFQLTVQSNCNVIEKVKGTQIQKLLSRGEVVEISEKTFFLHFLGWIDIVKSHLIFWYYV